MDYFNYYRGRLQCEDLAVEDIAAKHGTPMYLYSARTIAEHYQKLKAAFARAGDIGGEPIICYSVKANSNLSILKLMKDLGSGFDVVSAGELYRVLKVGGDPRKVAFAGVGKTDDEIAYALDSDILMFNVESEEELENISRIAQARKKVATVALRINPDVDPHTHTYITTGKKENKFGVDLDRAKQVLARSMALPGVKIRGLHVHIGSQITKAEPYVETLTRVNEFLPAVRGLGLDIEFFDLGGGFGIWYKEKLARPVKEIADAVVPLLQKTGCRLLFEPGRFIVGNAGVLITRVQYVKQSGDKRFVICDAGMNDLIRPSLYGAYHRIWPVATEPSVTGEVPDEEQWTGAGNVTDIVGPICESGDYFAKDRRLPPLKRGDLVCIFSAGAYGYAMASTYNSHPRPVEVMVAGKDAKVVSVRESYEDLLKPERIETFRV